MENVDARLGALGFKKKGSEWHRVEEDGQTKFVVFFSKSWDVWILERHTKGPGGRFGMEGKDWTEHVLASDLLRFLE